MAHSPFVNAVIANGDSVNPFIPLEAHLNQLYDAVATKDLRGSIYTGSAVILDSLQFISGEGQIVSKAGYAIQSGKQLLSRGFEKAVSALTAIGVFGTRKVSKLLVLLPD